MPKNKANLPRYVQMKKKQPSLKCTEIYGESHGLHSVVSECFIGGSGGAE